MRRINKIFLKANRNNEMIEIKIEEKGKKTTQNEIKLKYKRKT